MSRLTKQDEIDILNRVDDIKSLLYHDVVRPEDTNWAIKTINKLLLEIHFQSEPTADTSLVTEPNKPI